MEAGVIQCGEGSLVRNSFRRVTGIDGPPHVVHIAPHGSGCFRPPQQLSSVTIQYVGE